MKRIASIVLALGVTTTASAATTREIPSAFLISKSQNKNQVHYAVRVDDSCAPQGPQPVYAYWRMLERDPNATEPLLDREQRAYGIQSQTVDASSVRITLNALPSRPVTITTWRAQDGTCASSASTVIHGASARLFNIHVALKLLGVDYVLFTGWAPDGSVVRERVSM